MNSYQDRVMGIRTQMLKVQTALINLCPSFAQSTSINAFNVHSHCKQLQPTASQRNPSTYTQNVTAVTIAELTMEL